MSSRIAIAGLLSLWFALPAAVPQQVQEGAQGGSLEFESKGSGLTLVDLIDQAKVVTGDEIFFDPRDLEKASVNFSGHLTVSREKFLSFFTWCLHEEGFVDVEHVVADRRMHTIVKLGNQSGRGAAGLKSSAPVVDRQQLAAMSDRWSLVTTTYETKNLPAREAVTTMQLYFADSATEAIRNIEGTDLIVMTGQAANLAAVVAMLDRIDAQASSEPVVMSMRSLSARIDALETEIAGFKHAAPAGGK